MVLCLALSLLVIRQWGRLIAENGGTEFVVPITYREEMFRASSTANGKAITQSSIEPLGGKNIAYALSSSWVAWIIICR